MAIAPLTINEDRQRVVDFTKQFMKTGISIMIKKPDKEKPGVFSFMYPLSNLVWLCVMVAFISVSLVLFFVGRWSPYEWGDIDPKLGTPTNHFSLLNTLWFSLGALMQQGSDTFPRLVSVLSATFNADMPIHRVACSCRGETLFSSSQIHYLYDKHLYVHLKCTNSM